MDARTLPKTVVTALVELEKLEFSDLLQVRTWVDHRLRLLAACTPPTEATETDVGEDFYDPWEGQD